MHYRKIWEQFNGKIPIDNQGRPYEIHHIDGDRNNNSIENLMCVSIEDHYKIHYQQNDFGACVMIAKRMSLPSNQLSSIQKGVKRPGIGGVKKGTIPWNKGKSGYKLNLSEESRKRMGSGSKKTAKIKDSDINLIIKKYDEKIVIDDDRINRIQRNGKLFTYKRAFCEYIAKEYNVTTQNIVLLLKKYVQEEQ